MGSVWITSIFEEGFNKVIFYDDVHNLTLHTNIDKDGKIESKMIQPSNLKGYTVREVI